MNTRTPLSFSFINITGLESERWPFRIEIRQWPLLDGSKAKSRRSTALIEQAGMTQKRPHSASFPMARDVVAPSSQIAPVDSPPQQTALDKKGRPPALGTASSHRGNDTSQHVRDRRHDRLLGKGGLVVPGQLFGSLRHRSDWRGLAVAQTAIRGKTGTGSGKTGIGGDREQ